MTEILEFTILGSGSSGGVPRSDGVWGRCDPADPRNQRSRCSLLVRRKGQEGEETSLIVDTAPELRQQAVAAEVRRLDAVLYTHDHADQTHGIDDIRPFYQHQRQVIDCWMDAATLTSLTRRFDYVFETQGGYPAIARPALIPPHGDSWFIRGPSGRIPVKTFDQAHGPIRSVGYRFGGVAYSPDVSSLDEAAFAALQGLDVWIVDALRDTPHPTHANVEAALSWIARLKPKRAILTDLHIDLDYQELNARLPPGVEAAYDGLRFDHLIE
ncbi:MBL fold metallo-hydrolase [Phenylobacterium immobile]|uniref:MBL fold metallo-hydrolase n=1 Tax=Phenylobacterium immobile TaxID=21 RepID=UPI000B28A4A2|nr:MBL fold metallo-hydrolase [Phenylobacterium immobile]